MSKEDFPIYNQLLVNIEKRNATIEALGMTTEQKLQKAKELAELYPDKRSSQYFIGQLTKTFEPSATIILLAAEALIYEDISNE